MTEPERGPLGRLGRLTDGPAPDPGVVAEERKGHVLALNDETFETVLEAAKSGAEWAWATIYTELAGPVKGYLGRRGASDPEDVTSEVFLQVTRSIHGFTGGLSAFRSWVFVIAHRRLIDERRLRGRRPQMTELDEKTTNLSAGDVEAEAVERLVTDELRRAFDQLSEAQRDVLALRIIGGLTLEETAQVLGKRTGAIKAAQRRALEALREKMEMKGVSQ